MTPAADLVMVGEDLAVTTLERVRSLNGKLKYVRYTCTCRRTGQWHERMLPAEAIAVVHAVTFHNAPRPRG